jgi:hypothetical protein
MSSHNKSSEEPRNRRNILQHYKGYIWQIYRPLVNIILNGKNETLSSKIKKETKVSTLDSCTLVQEFPARAIRQKKEIWEIEIRKEEVKLSLFADDMILYLKDPKTSSKAHLDLINTFNKLAGYKINTNISNISKI